MVSIAVVKFLQAVATRERPFFNQVNQLFQSRAKFARGDLGGVDAVSLGTHNHAKDPRLQQETDRVVALARLDLADAEMVTIYLVNVGKLNHICTL